MTIKILSSCIIYVTGITRKTILDLSSMNPDLYGLRGTPVIRNISLAEFHAADEVFTTGSMGEITPVVEIDGRSIGEGFVGPITKRLQIIYRGLANTQGVLVPI